MIDYDCIKIILNHKNLINHSSDKKGEAKEKKKIILNKSWVAQNGIFRALLPPM